MCKKTGCCGSIVRIYLIFLNLFYLILGAALFIGCAVILWSTVLDNEINQLSAFLRIDVRLIINVLYVLLAVGGLVTFVSFLGLVGSLCANRCFLIAYEMAIGLVFVAHLASFITGLVYLSKSEQTIKNIVRSRVDRILEVFDTVSTFDSNSTSCPIYLGMSRFLQCCDFKYNTQFINNCCHYNYSGNCVDAAFEYAKKNFGLMVLLPNASQLVYELLLFVFVIYLLNKIGSYYRKKNSHHEEVHCVSENNAAVAAAGSSCCDKSSGVTANITVKLQ